MSVGTPEILVILLVALLVFGPQRLPDVARQVGGAMRELRRIQDTVRGELDMVLHPEHGTRSSDAPNEPGDHTGDGYDHHTGDGYVDHTGDGYVDHTGDGYVDHTGDGYVDEHVVRSDLGNGYSDFTPPDALNPAEADRDAEEERRFLGPPDSFI
jgi:Tat protein translocase TatB subunit